MYRVFITYNSIRLERRPLYDSIQYSWQREKGQLFFNKIISNAFTFVNDAKTSIADFTFFKSIEETDVCATVYIDIEKMCNGSWILDAQGLFSVRDGSWDNDKCTFTIVPSGLTNWNCLTKNVSVNMLQTTPTVTTHFVDPGYGTTDYARCRLLNDVIEYVAFGTCPELLGVKSDFFQINPDNPSTINYVTLTPNLYTQITISQKSDTFLPTPTNPATKGSVTWVELLTELNTLFNVYWYIDSQGYVHVEHLSFFDSTVGGLDLTQSQYEQYVKAMNRYSYDRTNMPQYEGFEQMPDELRPKSRLIYDNLCGSVEGDGSERMHKSALFFSSYDEMFGVNDTPDGFVFWATRYNAGTGQYDHIWDEFYRQTHYWHTSPMQLMLRFFRHGNVQLEGRYVRTTHDASWAIGGIEHPVIFFTASKNKKQVPLTIPLCCVPGGGSFFDPTKKVLTTLGYGDIDAATFTSKNGTLTMTLKYGPEARVLYGPEAVSGMDLWLKGDVGVITSFGIVTSWQDQSGNGRHFDNPFAGTVVPGAPLNGFMTVYFDGLSGLQSTLAWQPFPAKRGTIFIVHKHDYDFAFEEYIIGTNQVGSGNEFCYTREPVGNSFYYHIDNIVAVVPFLSDQSANNYRIGVFQRTSDPQMRYIGNGMEGKDAPVTITNTVQPASRVWSIGYDPYGFFPNGISGNIAEVIVYNRELTYVERQNIETYLSRKWGIEAI